MPVELLNILPFKQTDGEDSELILEAAAAAAKRNTENQNKLFLFISLISPQNLKTDIKYVEREIERDSEGERERGGEVMVKVVHNGIHSVRRKAQQKSWLKMHKLKEKNSSFFFVMLMSDVMNYLY